MRKSGKWRRGFGLVEILVTLGVLSVGIVGVTVLQSTVAKQSSENKSRAEALAIAQSRIEDMRNYTGDVDTLTEFNTLFANTSGYANSTTVIGTNAAFTRTEKIASLGDLKALTVRVTWTDSENEAQAMHLNTRLSFIAPRSIGDTALEAAVPVVDAPTGRARFGEGELPQGATTTSNGDGTSLYEDGGTDLMLVSGKQIVLTLTEACQTEDGGCIDFVKIKGRIYIDQASQSSLSPGEIYVIASDAAFCARHFMPENASPDDEASPVTSNTTNTRLTANGNYEWFDYTCYIGGGWHGNVGILLAGGLASSDKICIGDPVTADAWATPVIASRRVYRGMLYKPDPHGSTTIPGDGGTTIRVESYEDHDGSKLPRFYSHGIADGTQLPADGEPSHDFVIGSFQQELTEGSNCKTQGPMWRTDSTVGGDVGGLFANMPADFVCLNDGHLDHFDSDVYANRDTCPYDPSHPPSTRHVISGSISLDADKTTANDVIAASVKALTSDGPGNCLWSLPVHDGTHYQFSYQCDVYDWGNGWNGYIEANYDASEMECAPYRITRSNVRADTRNVNFTACTTGSLQ